MTIDERDTGHAARQQQRRRHGLLLGEGSTLVCCEGDEASLLRRQVLETGDRLQQLLAEMEEMADQIREDLADVRTDE